MLDPNITTREPLGNLMPRAQWMPWSNVFCTCIYFVTNFLFDLSLKGNPPQTSSPRGEVTVTPWPQARSVVGASRIVCVRMCAYSCVCVRMASVVVRMRAYACVCVRMRGRHVCGHAYGRMEPRRLGHLSVGPCGCGRWRIHACQPSGSSANCPPATHSTAHTCRCRCRLSA